MPHHNAPQNGDVHVGQCRCIPNIAMADGMYGAHIGMSVGFHTPLPVPFGQGVAAGGVSGVKR